MPMVMPEWKASIKEVIDRAWNAGEIKSFEDFDRIAREACQSIPIQNKTLAARAISAVKANSSVMVILRQEAAKAKLPITKESPIDDLPISRRVRRTLCFYNDLHQVGDVVALLQRKDKGQSYAYHMGNKTREEIYVALGWAGIEIPSAPEVAAAEEAEAAEEDIFNEEEGLESWRLVKVDDTRERKIVLHAGEKFIKEFSPLDGRVVIICEGQKLTIFAKKVTITAEG